MIGHYNLVGNRKCTDFGEPNLPDRRDGLIFPCSKVDKLATVRTSAVGQMALGMDKRTTNYYVDILRVGAGPPLTRINLIIGGGL